MKPILPSSYTTGSLFPSTRRRFAALTALCAVALLGSTACSSGTESGAGGAATMQVGISGAISDAPFYLADALGYFRDAKLDVVLTPFASSSDMIAPLGTGDLQVGASAATPALYNAIDRGVALRIVADKGRVRAGASYQAILVAKQLYDSGQVRSIRDLAGRPVADYAESSTTSAFLNAGLTASGLTLGDIQRAYITGSQHMAALQNGSVAASVTPEPFVTAAVEAGAAVRLPESDRIYPDQQTSVVLYSERFAAENQDVAQRFMTAYLRGARAFNDAVSDSGTLTGPSADQIVQILADRTSTPAATLRKIIVNGVSPNGDLSMDSLRGDLDFFTRGGWITNPNMSLQACIDASFAQRAVADLGPYARS